MSENTGRPLTGRILVVDDLNDAAASLALVCELYGAQARVARDGLEALSVGADFLPDVVLMDISMPYMDGYEAGLTRGVDVALATPAGERDENYFRSPCFRSQAARGFVAIHIGLSLIHI